MQNEDLSRDYLFRAKGRLKALDTLLKEKLWADVVRESQEVVELALKSLLRYHLIEIPRVHDVSGVLEANTEKFPTALRASLPELMDISQDLRRDRELAFYGSEDVTPHEFYKEKHAKKAIEQAKLVVSVCVKHTGLLSDSDSSFPRPTKR
jgi:HEPN domain-containing protein